MKGVYARFACVAPPPMANRPAQLIFGSPLASGCRSAVYT